MKPEPSAVDLARSALDLLCSFAQPVAKADEGMVRFRWGEHLWDESGDNTGQYGVHGIAEAVTAIASLPRPAASSHYNHYLRGGIESLGYLYKSPKSPDDLRKVTKLGPLIGALAAAPNPPSELEEALKLLLAGKCVKGAWSFDISAKSSPDPKLVASLYALDALARSAPLFPTAAEPAKETAARCLQMIISERQHDQRWVASLCRFIEIITTPASLLFDDDLISNALELVDARAEMGLDVAARFEYRIAKASHGEEAAFCVIPVGLLAFRARLARAKRLGRPDENAEVAKKIHDFRKAVQEHPPELYIATRNCAAAVRMLDAVGDMFDRLSPSGLGIPELLSDSSALPALPASPSPAHSPFPNSKSEREALYLRTLDKPDHRVTRVRILQELTGGLSDARLDLCEVRAENEPEVPQVLKLTNVIDGAQEEKGATAAARHIDPRYRVDIKPPMLVDSNSGLAVLVFNYASHDYQPGRLISFLDHLERDEQGSKACIRELFTKALKPTATPYTGSIGDIRDLFEQARGGKYWSSVKDGFHRLFASRFAVAAPERQGRLLLSYPFQTVINPFDWTPDPLTSKQLFPVPQVQYSHGDLNPRNLLIFTDDQQKVWPVLLDFHRFGSMAPLALDFARLEAGIQVKGLKSYINAAYKDRQEEYDLIRYEELVNGSLDIQISLEMKSILNPVLLRQCRIVQELRKCYSESTPRETNDNRAFFAILMFSYFGYLRPIYDRILSVQQRLFAIFSAIRILQRYFA